MKKWKRDDVSFYLRRSSSEGAPGSLPAFPLFELTLAEKDKGNVKAREWGSSLQADVCILRVVLHLPFFDRTRYFLQRNGRITRLAQDALFCCTCLETRDVDRTFFDMTPDRRIARFCDTCRSELVCVSDLKEGIEKSIQHDMHTIISQAPRGRPAAHAIGVTFKLPDAVTSTAIERMRFSPGKFVPPAMKKLARENSADTRLLQVVQWKPSGETVRSFLMKAGEVRELRSTEHFCCQCRELREDGSFYFDLIDEDTFSMFCRQCYSECLMVCELSPGIERSLPLHRSAGPQQAPAALQTEDGEFIFVKRADGTYA